MLVRGIMTTMSGSLGGITAARNKGGQYLRARVVPVNPSSFPQTSLRTIFGSLANSWGTTLTAAQRAAWDTYASNVTVVNRIGETINLTGFQQYIRSNTPRKQALLPQVDDGPTTMNIGDFSPMTVSIVGGGTTLSIAFDDTDDWVDEDDAAVLVLAGREQAATINFFKGPYRFAGTVLGDATTPPTTPVAVTSKFSYTSANKGFVQVRVSRADGRLSATQLLGAIAS